MAEYFVSDDSVMWVKKICMGARNVPIEELNAICLDTGGYLDVAEEEIVLVELIVEEKVDENGERVNIEAREFEE